MGTYIKVERWEHRLCWVRHIGELLLLWEDQGKVPSGTGVLSVCSPPSPPFFPVVKSFLNLSEMIYWPCSPKLISFPLPSTFYSFQTKSCQRFEISVLDCNRRYPCYMHSVLKIGIYQQDENKQELRLGLLLPSPWAHLTGLSKDNSSFTVLIWIMRLDCLCSVLLAPLPLKGPLPWVDLALRGSE